jgi:hypothetical protein
MEDGLVNVGALKNMYTYLTSWQIIEVEMAKAKIQEKIQERIKELQKLQEKLGVDKISNK